MDTHGPGGDLRGNEHPLVQTMCGQIYGNMTDASTMKTKQRWIIEKPKLDNARHLKRIFVIDTNDEEFKLTMKVGRRMLENPMPETMPCKIPNESSGNPPQCLETQHNKNLCCC